MRQKSKQKAFLKGLRDFLGVAPAADAAGISRATVYRWRSEDPDFAKAWDDAIEAALDDVEKSLHERAKTKDTLAAIAILRNRRRAIYNDNSRIEVEHHHNPPVQQLPIPAEVLAQAIHLLVGATHRQPPVETVIEAEVSTVPPHDLPASNEKH